MFFLDKRVLISFAETSLYLRAAGEREKESARGRWEGEEIKRGTR